MNAQIEMDGLFWGASGLEEVGYGIKKLRITCVVEDDKVGLTRVKGGGWRVEGGGWRVEG